MKIVQNESDFAKLRMEGNIDTAIINYIDAYFKQFAARTEHSLPIQDVGMIVINRSKVKIKIKENMNDNH